MKHLHALSSDRMYRIVSDVRSCLAVIRSIFISETAHLLWVILQRKRSISTTCALFSLDLIPSHPSLSLCFQNWQIQYNWLVKICTEKKLQIKKNITNGFFNKNWQGCAQSWHMYSYREEETASYCRWLSIMGLCIKMELTLAKRVINRNNV
jgi:hypothetical protein